MRDITHTIDLIKEQLEGVTVEMRECAINNDVHAKHIVITPIGSNIGASMRVSYYADCMSDEMVAADMVKRYRDSLDHTPDIDISSDPTRIIARLIGKEKNAELLDTIPYIDFLDMAVTFRYVFTDKDSMMGTTLITNQLQKKLGMSLQDLYVNAVKNMGNATFQSIMHILQGYYPEQELDFDIPMYVLTAKNMTNGAVFITFPNIAKKIGSVLGDFIMLPSSINEVIIVPSDGSYDIDELRSLVELVNSTEVQPDEVLTDNVYLYSVENDSWRIG